MVLVWNRGSFHVSLTGLELAGLQFMGIPILLLLGEGYFTPLLGGEGKPFGYFPWRSVQDLDSCVMIKHRFYIWVAAWYREGGAWVWSWGPRVKAAQKPFQMAVRGLGLLLMVGRNYVTTIRYSFLWEVGEKPGRGSQGWAGHVWPQRFGVPLFSCSPFLLPRFLPIFVSYKCILLMC